MNVDDWQKCTECTFTCLFFTFSSPSLAQRIESTSGWSREGIDFMNVNDSMHLHHEIPPDIDTIAPSIWRNCNFSLLCEYVEPRTALRFNEGKLECESRASNHKITFPPMKPYLHTSSSIIRVILVCCVRCGIYFARARVLAQLPSDTRLMPCVVCVCRLPTRRSNDLPKENGRCRYFSLCALCEGAEDNACDGFAAKLTN